MGLCLLTVYVICFRGEGGDVMPETRLSDPVGPIAHGHRSVRLSLVVARDRTESYLAAERHSR